MSMQFRTWPSSHLLQTHAISATEPGAQDSDVVTSLALSKDWIIVGLANCLIYDFSARTGDLKQTLIGHDSGIWVVCLVQKGGYMGPDPSHDYVVNEGNILTGEAKEDSKDGDGTSRASLQLPLSSRIALGLGPGNDTGDNHGHHPSRHDHSDCDDDEEDGGWDTDGGPRVCKPSGVSGHSEGWGQTNDLVVSGGCDKVVRVWDIQSGQCMCILRGHTSTIRCLKVLHNRPIVVSGSRDNTVRVWDIQQGLPLRTLAGHMATVRCLDVCGNRVVSGSYDDTCRVIG
ncbi:WD40 repeat-like protein [Gymnopus androsaceus JB14]|uniref:WD40 repeat-like protein n=1 Tax=Gymnopus androsaceus JB14 TaxID=1447944 RepID=A0A6A4I3P8_9AGAR|nr:WD40 repeat-like protein [Gymnopus androsaceus JB14]